MKKKLAFIALLTGLIMAFGFSACGEGQNNTTPDDDGPVITDPDKDDDKEDGDNDDGQTEKKVNKITIKTEPEQTEYWVGDTFSVEGGVITVSYRGGETEDVAMTDERVELPTVNMNVESQSKPIKITFGGKSATFYIKIKLKGGVVTFDYNYDGAPAATDVQSELDAVLESDEAPAPSRSGYTFDKWYEDKACTVEYLFNSPVDDDKTLYAGWKQDGETYVNFTYDLNYYGVAVQQYTQSVKSGDAARTLGITPARGEFSFEGWYTDAACNTQFTASSAITQNTTVYAKWTKTKTQSSTYTFEAEQVSMEGQEGPGLSGGAGGAAMMVTATNEGVSGKVVSYLYKRGVHVDFCLASSEDASATLTVYVCAEFKINLNSDMYKMTLTNSAGEQQELSYSAVSLEKGGPVVGITIQNVQLKQGENVISLITDNDDNPTGVAGSGTYEGTAPMIDRISLTTEAVVIWDAAKGMPWDNG